MKQIPLRWLSLALCFLMLLSVLSACQTEEVPQGTSSTTTAPVTTEPVTTAPITTEPVTTEPVTTVPTTTVPGTTVPTTTEPVTEAPETLMPIPENEVFYPNVSEDDLYESRVLNTIDKNVADLLKIQGRTATTSNGITLDWSGSAVEFYAYFSGDLSMTFTVSPQESVLFRVFVDYEELGTVAVEAGKTKSYVMAESIPEGRHLVRVLRLTDVETNCVGIMAELCSIELCGVLTNRPEDRAYMIEFLGDSVTCAVGAKSAYSGGAYADLSFAYKVAQKLNADYSMVCISGIGTMTGTSRHNARGDNILTIYDYINHYRTKQVKYSPTRKADLVVIATNANDAASPNEKAYKAHVKELIELIKKTHGEDVKIMWVFNMYTSRATLDTYVRQIFKEYGGKEAGYYTQQLTVDNSGGENHPTAESHDKYASSIVNLINRENILP